MAHSVFEAMKAKKFDAFAAHIHPSFAAELKQNPKLIEELAGFIPQSEPIKPPKLYALEDVKYEGYGDILMATFDFPYENRNMLFLIAFDAAEGSTEIKSLAVNTFPGSGDYLPSDEESAAEAGSAPETALLPGPFWAFRGYCYASPFGWASFSTSASCAASAS